MFTKSQMSSLINSTITAIHHLRNTKGGEYSGDDDSLANFRRNGLALGMPMESIWAVYAAKHWDAIMQFVKDTNSGRERVRTEPIEGRVDDLLVYLLLFKGILEDRKLANSSSTFQPLDITKEGILDAPFCLQEPAPTPTVTIVKCQDCGNTYYSQNGSPCKICKCPNL